MTRTTLVCERCCDGWEIDGEPGPDPRCTRCGGEAIERGRYSVREVRP